MYTTTASDIPAGRQYRVFEDNAPVTFRRFFELLGTDDGFADWYTAELVAFDAAAFYWELPPLTSRALEQDAEFVLIEAPSLARFAPEPAPFAEHFRRAPGEDVIVFPNLGGDAVMIVPCPRGPVAHYPYLAAFVRDADPQQVRALWHRTAEEMLRHVGTRPTWLSTAGGGVAWLHVRLDSRPKYYSHAPYRTL